VGLAALPKASAPDVTSRTGGLLLSLNLWSRLSLSHPFFKHENIMYLLALGIGAVKCNRPRLSIA
jgi:hypothetical protein